MAKKVPSNGDIAGILDQMADLLEARKENPFRIQSYRHAAEVIRDAKQPVEEIVRTKGTAGLTAIRGVGAKLAGVVQEYVETGEVELLETLKKETPDAEVEEAARGQQERKREEAPERRAAITMPVDVILDVDEEYRAKADGDKLRKIAPRQFNPEGKAWLPVLSTTREGYKFTVMFSNTARAHELGKTDDWVVVYFKKGGGGESQCTVVTEHRGPMKGKRVIRGRESECAKYYGIQLEKGGRR